MSDEENTPTPEMPFFRMVLEKERAEREESPDKEATPREEIVQFIIDQEVAVQRDFEAGRISATDYEAFRALSESKVEEFTTELKKEFDEYVDDLVEETADEVEAAKPHIEEAKEIHKDHEETIKQLRELEKEGELEAKDIPLDLAADYAGVAAKLAPVGIKIEAEIIEESPEHLHDIVDVYADHTHDIAHDLVAARADMEGVDLQEIENAQQKLEQLDTLIEEGREEYHADIDRDFEKKASELNQRSAEIERLQDAAEVAKEHAELNPDATVEHMPYQTIEDPEVIEAIEEIEEIEEIEDDTGIADA